MKSMWPQHCGLIVTPLAVCVSHDAPILCVCVWGKGGVGTSSYRCSGEKKTNKNSLLSLSLCLPHARTHLSLYKNILNVFLAKICLHGFLQCFYAFSLNFKLPGLISNERRAHCDYGDLFLSKLKKKQR